MLKSNTKKYILFTAVIALLIFLYSLGILPGKALINNIFNPVFGRFYSASSFFNFTGDNKLEKEELINLVENLKEEVKDLVAENSRLKILEEENETMREYLNFYRDSNKTFVLGNIIARENLILSDSGRNIIIDKGEKDGVKIGAGVISGQGFIVGKVREVKNESAEICLITNSGCKLAVSAQNKDKTSGIVQGEMGLTTKMEFIPQTEEVNVGDTIITSGLEENIPRGLIVGRVSAVNKENNELWQSATIEPLVDLDRLLMVSVLTSN